MFVGVAPLLYIRLLTSRFALTGLCYGFFRKKNGRGCGILSVAQGFFYGESAFGIDLLSVIRSSGVSAVEGYRTYGSLRRNNRDPKLCRPLRGVR